MQELWGLSILPIIETVVKKISIKLETKIIMEFRDLSNLKEEFIPFKIYDNGQKIADHCDKYSHLLKDVD